ncbi:MAG TPA: kelch repeat-containing protein [Verrucomicrobiae bacterium]|nr:kelch repeat-containing protein [Verrucomicrobiae bacterium]
MLAALPHRATRAALSSRCRWLGVLLAVCAPFIPPQAMAAGTWTALAHNAPGSVDLMLLLSDGTVMAQQAGVSSSWYRLTPDIHGSYVNGTWTTLAAMHDARLYFASQVLKDGRVFVAGGEYGSAGLHSANSSTAEVYDPLANVWTSLPSSGKDFYDSVSKTLPNGNVLVAPVYSGGTVIFNYGSNTWTDGPNFIGVDDQDEASWVKLPDDSILTIDPFGVNSERYIPSSNTWVNDGVVPVSLYDSLLSELGAAFLLPNGKAFFLGSTGHTALYAPTGTTSPGIWTAGPNIPNGQGTPDAAAAMMVNGKILCAVSPSPTTNNFPTPTSFYEYDPVSNAFTQANAPAGGTSVNHPSYWTAMLDLPDGTVLYSEFSSRLYVYRPDGSPLAAGKPAISRITPNADGSYHLTGTLLNGISEGAAYGDDWQMNSNYPIIRLTDAAGNVRYARTYNWSSTGVMTGTTPETTEFRLPTGLAAGIYSLVVVANGISSDPVSFYTPDALQIKQLNNQAVISWPSSATNAVLEVATSLAAGDWTAVTSGVTVVGNNYVLTNSPGLNRGFFRLHGH